MPLFSFLFSVLGTVNVNQNLRKSLSKRVPSCLVAGVKRQRKDRTWANSANSMLTLRDPLFPVRPHHKDSLSQGSDVQIVGLWGIFHISNHNVLVS